METFIRQLNISARKICLPLVLILIVGRINGEVSLAHDFQSTLTALGWHALALSLPVMQANACTGDGIYLYEHSNYQGRCRKFISDHSDLKEIDFDNIASSIRFVGSYEPWRYRVTLCEHKDYGGKCSPFFIGDDPNLGNNVIGHDRTSSLRIGPIDYFESLRIGTYNVQFLPTEFVTDGCCEDIPGRVSKIAERILAAEYDIIILNEAFIDDIQDGLESRIREYYPHYIKYIDVDEANFDQDSGLMLFSRYPFVPIENNLHPADDVVAYNGVQGNWDDVAFLQYEDFDFGCSNDSGDDCKADKGVAYVRVWNPIADRIYNVVFTHMDAGSTSSDKVARAVNFTVSKKLIQETMTEERINTEDIFFLGDLNVNGDHSIVRSEWALYFATPGSFFTDVLQDVWEYQMQRNLPSEFSKYRDRGLTSDVPALFGDPVQKRLDYFIRNNPEPTFNDELCVQHMTVAYNLRHGAPYGEGVLANVGFQDLSDHYGVNADINRKAPYCSPDTARENPPLDTVIEGEIKYPGSMQWFRLDPDIITDTQGQVHHFNGTYSIEIRSNGPVDFQVFKSSNLSAPLPRLSGNIVATSWTYHVTNEPFYIRVFAKDRRWIGDYELIIHKHQGKGKRDAIILHPSESLGVYFAQNETKWFQINTEAPDNDAAQIMVFELREPAFIELKAADGLTVIEEKRLEDIIIRNNVLDNDTQIYMLVTNDPDDKRLNFVGWATTLTVLHSTLEQPIMLRAKEPTEGGFGDDDEIKTLKIRADGILVKDSGSLGGFDDGQIRGLGDKVEPIRFLQDLQLELIEEDGVPNPDDHMHGAIPPLDSRQSSVYYRADLTGDGGHYTLDVTLSHGLQFAYPNLSNVYVDINATGFEDGSITNPFNTVTEGVDAVLTGGVVWIFPGTYPETLMIDQAMELRSTGGIVTIGTP